LRGLKRKEYPKHKQNSESGSRLGSTEPVKKKKKVVKSSKLQKAPSANARQTPKTVKKGGGVEITNEPIRLNQPG